MEGFFTKADKWYRKSLGTFLDTRIQLIRQNLQLFVTDHDTLERIMETIEGSLITTDSKKSTSKSSVSRKKVEHSRLCEVLIKTTGEPCSCKTKNNPVFCNKHAPKGCLFVKGYIGKKESQCKEAICMKSSSGKYCRAHLAYEDPDRSKVVLRKNPYGKLQHDKTGIIFNEKQEAVGFSAGSGKVSPLSDIDLRTIYYYRFHLVSGYKERMAKVLEDIKAESAGLSVEPVLKRKTAAKKTAAKKKVAEPVEKVVEPVEKVVKPVEKVVKPVEKSAKSKTTKKSAKSKTTKKSAKSKTTKKALKPVVVNDNALLIKEDYQNPFDGDEFGDDFSDGECMDGVIVKDFQADSDSDDDL